MIKNNFDLTPKGIIKYLNLDRPIYTKTTNYGHFGKKELPWEKVISIKNLNKSYIHIITAYSYSSSIAAEISKGHRTDTRQKQGRTSGKDRLRPAL